MKINPILAQLLGPILGQEKLAQIWAKPLGQIWAKKNWLKIGPSAWANFEPTFFKANFGPIFSSILAQHPA